MGLARKPLLLASALALLACGPGGVARVPLTFVVDRRGAVRWVGQGPGDARRAVDVVLSE